MRFAPMAQVSCCSAQAMVYFYFMQYTQFHGHTIAADSRAAYLAHLQKLLQSNACTQVVTINPEYIVLAHSQAKLKALTLPPNLAIPDGVGLTWALTYRGKHVERYPGVDMVLDLCAHAKQHNLSVGVLAAQHGLSSSSEIQAALQQRFPGLSVVVRTENDPHPDQAFRDANARILFVTFGQPRQDVWIAEHVQAMPTLRIAMGVGGAFDFLTGKRQRAPRLMQRLGVEWLWRLVTQPQRLPRMLRATFGFWYVILTTK